MSCSTCVDGQCTGACNTDEDHGKKHKHKKDKTKKHKTKKKDKTKKK